MDIGAIRAAAMIFRDRLEATKRSTALDGRAWYPYGTLDNFTLLDALLTGDNRNLLDLCGAGPAVDIGAADGDTAFFMESLGVPMHVVDYPPTNYNGCQGVRALKTVLGSTVEVLETDLDRQFELPGRRYSFAFFLGILYHLKNPFGALEALAAHAKHAVVSTRIARFNLPPASAAGTGGVNSNRIGIRTAPVAYLLDPAECNNDHTNYWIFSEAGLRRLFDRTGWDVLEFATFGNTVDSDPARADGDERAFALLRSRVI
jgi:tRNA (mo5U34)-methyltransferase